MVQTILHIVHRQVAIRISLYYGRLYFSDIGQILTSGHPRSGTIRIGEVRMYFVPCFYML